MAAEFEIPVRPRESERVAGAAKFEQCRGTVRVFGLEEAENLRVLPTAGFS